jgi:hypothetical protein
LESWVTETQADVDGDGTTELNKKKFASKSGDHFWAVFKNNVFKLSN